MEGSLGLQSGSEPKIHYFKILDSQKLSERLGPEMARSGQGTLKLAMISGFSFKMRSGAEGLKPNIKPKILRVLSFWLKILHLCPALIDTRELVGRRPSKIYPWVL